MDGGAATTAVSEAFNFFTATGVSTTRVEGGAEDGFSVDAAVDVCFFVLPASMRTFLMRPFTSTDRVGFPDSSIAFQTVLVGHEVTNGLFVVINGMVVCEKKLDI